MPLLQLLSLWFVLAPTLLSGSLVTNTGTVVPTGNPIRWAVEKTSTLKIAGKSNVNEFACSISGYYKTDTISYVEDGAGKAVRLNGSLEIDVLRFDCQSKMITNDLRKTLKVEDYPKLVIRFLSLERTPSLQGAPQTMKGWVEVELAGTRKAFQVAYEFYKGRNNSYILNGKRVFTFSDFKLVPPRKLAGAVKVRDEFAVDFNLRLVPLS
jgi:hypothetical protein